MDPVSMVVGALASGAATGLTEATAKAIKDAYAALKGLLARKYPSLSTSSVENKPESPVQRAALEESLRDADGDNDAELVNAAEALIEAIKAHDPEAAKTVGIDLTRVRAGELNVAGIRASGGSQAVRATDVSVAGAMTIKDVHTQGQDPDRP